MQISELLGVLAATPIAFQCTLNLDQYYPGSVSNGYNPLEWFRVRVGTGTEPLQQVLPPENSDR